MPVLTSSPTAALSPLPLVSKAVDALGDSLNAQMPAGDQGAALAVVATEAMTKPAIAAPNLAVVFPHMSLPLPSRPPSRVTTRCRWAETSSAHGLILLRSGDCG